MKQNKVTKKQIEDYIAFLEKSLKSENLKRMILRSTKRINKNLQKRD